LADNKQVLTIETGAIFVEFVFFTKMCYVNGFSNTSSEIGYPIIYSNVYQIYLLWSLIPCNTDIGDLHPLPVF
jgi:hypothetical protein